MRGPGRGRREEAFKERGEVRRAGVMCGLESCTGPCTHAVTPAQDNPLS